jgi:hypothetical protein
MALPTGWPVLEVYATMMIVLYGIALAYSHAVYRHDGATMQAISRAECGFATVSNVETGTSNVSLG